MQSSQKPPLSAIAVTDAIIIFTVVFSVQLFWPLASYIEISGNRIPGNLFPVYTWVSLFLSVIWLASIIQSGSLSTRNIGSGPREYNLVIKATIFTFVLVTLVSYLVKAEIARGFILLSIPVGLLLLLTERWLWRNFIVNKRKNGIFVMPAVVVGSLQSAENVAVQLAKHPEVGFQVVGAFISKHTQNNYLYFPDHLGAGKIPIWGSDADVLAIVRSRNIQHIIVSSTESLDAEDVRKLSWQLLPGDESLYLAANILDVTGPRLQIRPVAGIPLIEVLEPELDGLSQVLKRIIDLLLGTLTAVLSLPLLLTAAIQIKLFDGGNIFFVQTRVGKNGKLFRIYKFRTMRMGAESEVQNFSLDDFPKVGNEVLFKLKDDPRITVPGRWLRRTSVDELPQIFNVLLGNMSLVGPRPPLPSETEDYEAHVHTRFLVKPGITGLWQVSGRSDLSWEESVRADLFYVQNWSLIADLVILWRTFKVVITGKGAY